MRKCFVCNIDKYQLLFLIFFFRPKNHAVYWLLVILQFASKNMLFIVFYHMIHVQQRRHSEPEFQKQILFFIFQICIFFFRNPKKLPKNYPKIFENIIHLNFPITYIAFRGRKLFRACCIKFFILAHCVKGLFIDVYRLPIACSCATYQF